MTPDSNYKVPDGFEPVLIFPGGKEPGVPQVGKAQHDGLVFWIGGGEVPKLPLKMKGKLWHTGWDIETKFAIDADDTCWMDNAHGHPLEPCLLRALLSCCDEESQRDEIREVLGMPPEEPGWAQSARSKGWIPPNHVSDVLLQRVAEVESQLRAVTVEKEEYRARVGLFMRLAAKHGCEDDAHEILVRGLEIWRDQILALQGTIRTMKLTLSSARSRIAALEAELQEKGGAT